MKNLIKFIIVALLSWQLIIMNIKIYELFPGVLVVSILISLIMISLAILLIDSIFNILKK